MDTPKTTDLGPGASDTTPNPNVTNPNPGTPLGIQSLNPRRIPTLTKDHLAMIPQFTGEQMLLNHFIEVCDRLYNHFYDKTDPENFQNFYLFDSIKAKITGKAINIVFSHNISNYPDLKKVLLENFSDKRDIFTLISEMSKYSQRASETCFEFYQRVVNHLNTIIGYLQINKTEPSRSVLVEFARGYALRIFVNGLPETTGSLLRARKCESLDEVLIILKNEFNLSNQRNQMSQLFPKSTHNTKPSAPNSSNKPQNPFPAPTTPSNAKDQSNQNSTQNQGWKPTLNRPWQKSSSTPAKTNHSSANTQKTPNKPFQKSFDRNSSKTTTSTPKNFHLMEDDPEPSTSGYSQGNYVPGFFDGNNFFPYDFEQQFEQLDIQDDQNDSSDDFLEESPEQ